MESPIESFAPGDLIRISFSFRYTGGLELGDDIHVVFARPGTDDKLKLEGEVLMSAPEVPGRPYTVYTATARGRVTREVVPGDYVCKDIIAVDENGDDWPFTGLEKMDLTVQTSP